MRKSIVTGVIAGALALGGVGAALFLPGIVTAADPSASPTAAQTAAPSTGTTSAGTCDGGPGGHGGFGRPDEAVSDASIVAKAIGITEADLNTAIQGGQTVAAVAKAHNVPVQTVIDALVADGKTEVAAALKAGTITQAQADTDLANLTQRVTDQVNGTMGGHGGFGGFGDGHGPAGAPGVTG